MVRKKQEAEWAWLFNHPQVVDMTEQWWLDRITSFSERREVDDGHPEGWREMKAAEFADGAAPWERMVRVADVCTMSGHQWSRWRKLFNAMVTRKWGRREVVFFDTPWKELEPGDHILARVSDDRIVVRQVKEVFPNMSLVLATDPDDDDGEEDFLDGEVCHHLAFMPAKKK